MSTCKRLPAGLYQRWGLSVGSRLGVLATTFRRALSLLQPNILTCSRIAGPCWTWPSTHGTGWPAQQGRRLCPASCWVTHDCLHELPRVCLFAVSNCGLAGRPQRMSISSTWGTDCSAREQHCGLQALALQSSAAHALQHQSQPARLGGRDDMQGSFTVLSTAPPDRVLVRMCCLSTNPDRMPGPKSAAVLMAMLLLPADPVLAPQDPGHASGAGPACALRSGSPRPSSAGRPGPGHHEGRVAARRLPEDAAGTCEVSRLDAGQAFLACLVAQSAASSSHAHIRPLVFTGAAQAWCCTGMSPGPLGCRVAFRVMFGGCQPLAASAAPQPISSCTSITFPKACLSGRPSGCCLASTAMYGCCLFPAAMRSLELLR